ncbi:MAG: nuclear transport factor 2 family protein [Nocardioidaceae bacterium]|nr:nuclear transport factor 2 family protein [Nocardioidaceae bacterium]
MPAADLLRRLAVVLDEHRWDDLPALLHPELEVRYVHTGERFDVDAFVRLNADYPGFERFDLVDVVDAGTRAVGRARVTAHTDGQVDTYAVASFVTERDGLVGELVEVWTDVSPPPPGR